MAKWRPSMHEFSGSLRSSLRSIAHSSTAKRNANDVDDFSGPLTRACYGVRPQWLHNIQRRGVDKPQLRWRCSIYLLRTGGLRALFSLIAGVGSGGLVPRILTTALGRVAPRIVRTALGGVVTLDERSVLGWLVPRTEHAALGGLPLTSTAFHDCRTHAPRISIDCLSAAPGRFVARGSASVATTECCTGRGSILSAADTVFTSVSAIPIEGGTGSAKARLQRSPSRNRLLNQGVLHRRRTLPRPLVGLCPSLSWLTHQPLRRRRCADETRQ